MLLQVCGDRSHFGRERALVLTLNRCLDSFDHTSQIKVPFRKLAPLLSWKGADAGHIGRLEFDLPPLRIFRQFPPEASTATKQQGFTNGIVALIGKVRIRNNTRKPIAISIELRLIELSFQKLGNYFCFRSTSDLGEAS